MTISIVIPVFKSASTIGPLVEEIFKETGLEIEEIILVNDGSPDNTGPVCRDMVRAHAGRVLLLDLARNFGEHNAVMAGLNQCVGDIAVIMDDDFQNRPSEIRLLIEKMQEGKYDVVYGEYRHKYHGWFRNLGSWFNGIVFSMISEKQMKSYLSSFKAINRFIIDEITGYNGPFPYIDGHVFRATNRIGSVEVRHAPRETGTSNYSLRKLMGLWLNMLTNFSIYPLRFATLLGGTTILFGIGLTALVIYWNFTDPEVPSGWPTVICSLVIFSGVQLISLGIIGEYVGRLFLGNNATPQYVVREIVKCERHPKNPCPNPDKISRPATHENRA